MAQMNIWLLKSLPGLFKHAAYNDPAAPPDLFSSLAEMIELRCYFSCSRDSTRTLLGEPKPREYLGDRQMKIGKWKMRNK